MFGEFELITEIVDFEFWVMQFESEFLIFFVEIEESYIFELIESVDEGALLIDERLELSLGWVVFWKLLFFAFFIFD